MGGGLETLLSLIGDGAEEITRDPLAGALTWLLAGVFAIAGTTKLRRPAVAAMAMLDFGVIRRPRPALGAALGAAELTLAIVLVLGVAPAPTLATAALLLAVFATLIARALRAGDTFACFCLGDDDSEISRWTLARTATLAALAGALAATAPATATVLEGVHVLEAVAGASLLGTALLVARAPRLLRWDPAVMPEAA